MTIWDHRSFYPKAALLFFVCGTTAVAKDNLPAYTDPVAAGVDFKIQGEYAGIIQADGSRWGAQVIALGDGEFRCVGFSGGLPGDGWSRGDETSVSEGRLDGDVAILRGEHELRVDGEKIVVNGLDGERYGELKKVVRRSPTWGAKPSTDNAQILFDGANVDAWNNGELVDGKWLAASNPDTKEKFGDHSLHLEFRTPFMPKSRGQGRGNSGVYLQSRYEVQVLDSFGLDGKNNECGGIYSVSEPAVNMCFPPLSWQTYDIDFRSARFDTSGNKTENARVTVRHNGVVIHDDIQLPTITPGRLTSEDASPAPLYLQNHGNPVVFRNVWAVRK